MRRMTALAAVIILAALVTHLWAQPPAKTIQGYWMGIDPVDGGDQRRGFVEQADGTFAMAGRDTHLTLCDHSDYGIATFDDGVVGDKRRTLASDNLVLTCFGNGQTVALKARYELITDNLMTETVTMQDGTPVHTLFLHRVSQ